MENLKIKAIVIQPNDKEIPFEQSYKESSLSCQIEAMRKMQTVLNDCLTKLVNDEKSKVEISSSKAGLGKNVTKINESEESDVELEEDYIDAEIKKKLSVSQDGSLNLEIIKNNGKRSRSRMTSMKRLRQ